LEGGGAFSAREKGKSRGGQSSKGVYPLGGVRRGLGGKGKNPPVEKKGFAKGQRNRFESTFWIQGRWPGGKKNPSVIGETTVPVLVKSLAAENRSRAKISTSLTDRKRTVDERRATNGAFVFGGGGVTEVLFLAGRREPYFHHRESLVLEAWGRNLGWMKEKVSCRELWPGNFLRKGRSSIVFTR